jgi:hypothetical protein
MSTRTGVLARQILATLMSVGVLAAALVVSLAHSEIRAHQLLRFGDLRGRIALLPHAAITGALSGALYACGGLGLYAIWERAVPAWWFGIAALAGLALGSGQSMLEAAELGVMYAVARANARRRGDGIDDN